MNNTRNSEGSFGRPGTVTIRVPVSLRNNLKVIAAMKRIRLCELTDQILASYMGEFEQSIGLSVENFRKLPETE